MAVKVIPATIDDAEVITRLRVNGMENDALWKATMGNASYEEQMKYIGEGIRLRLGPGKEMEASQTWKAVDEDGCVIVIS